MVTGMPEANEDAGKKRWVGYTCPGCHAVFRVEARSLGLIAECPQCERPVALGGGASPIAPRVGLAVAAEESGGGTAPATAESESEGVVSPYRSTAEAAPRAERERRRRFGPGHAPAERLGWEDDGGDAPEGGRGLSSRWVLVGLVVLTVGAGILLKPMLESRKEVTPGADRSLAQSGVETGAGAGGLMSLIPESEEELDSIVENVPMESELKRVTEAVERFSTAATVDELLESIRDGERLEKVVRSYYEQTGYEPEGVRKIASNGLLELSGDFSSVQVVLDDYSTRNMAILRAGEDGRSVVDWESWVGYGEMGWEELQERKPTESIVMRVFISRVDYYNFDFSDDHEWYSYRLLDLTGEHTLYGYAPRLTALSRLLGAGEKEGKERLITVGVRYPEGASSRNQVIIDRFIFGGWVQPIEMSASPTP